MRNVLKRWALPLLALIPCVGLVALARQSETQSGGLPNRLPQAAPYDVAEARHFPPPFEEAWEGTHNPGKCATCHAKIFSEWNGSMMSNSWRDPGWRAAFLLASRQTSTAGGCEAPAPPGGPQRAVVNPLPRGRRASPLHTRARPPTT